tara:strand:- start:12 stop:698 length:687 start_codon:yes stop_codon:yes gene_type:complete
MNVKFFRVGGCVRDKLLGLKSKDIDFSVEAISFAAMKEAIEGRGGEIFLETPEFFTIRARVPELGAADFVLCRKDGEYSDGRHPDKVVHGTLEDDLARRDFTMNAIAEAEDGTLIDPHNGVQAIEDKEIICVGDAVKRFEEDSLRLLRALRFSITKQFALTREVAECMRSKSVAKGLVNVSDERIREEMLRCFKHDTHLTLRLLEHFHVMRDIIFSSGTLKLIPSLKK